MEFEENVRKAALSYKDALRFGFSSKKVINLPKYVNYKRITISR